MPRRLAFMVDCSFLFWWPLLTSPKELDCRFGESQKQLSLHKKNNVMVRMKHVTTIGIEFSYLTVSPQLELNSLTGEVVDHWGTAAGWVVPRDEWCSWKAQKRKQRQSQSSALLSESKSKTLVGLQNTVCCFQTNPLSPCAGVAFSWERAETRYILGGALKAKGEFVNALMHLWLTVLSKKETWGIALMLFYLSF